MSAKEFEVNGTDYKIVLTDQVIGHVNNLKTLYNAAYEDPESFEDVSSEISSTINEIAGTVEPPAEDSDLDGLIQEIIKAVDNKSAEIEKELQQFGNVEIDTQLSIVCVAGDFSQNKEGISATVFNALREIPIRMISYGGSNYNVSLLVKTTDKVAALNSLNEELFVENLAV